MTEEDDAIPVTVSIQPGQRYRCGNTVFEISAISEELDLVVVEHAVGETEIDLTTFGNRISDGRYIRMPDETPIHRRTLRTP